MAANLPNPAFWRGKQVLLTGHTGFKGTWLAFWLERLGADVTGFALEPEPAGLADRTGIERRIRSIRGDLRDRARLQSALRGTHPQIVLHLAAQALVRRSYQEPVETVAVNVLGTAHLLEAACLVPDLRAVVVVTTDKCYENREWPWAYRETDRLGGHDLYSASKACAELLTAAWRRSFLSDRPTGLATARAGNVIGGGDWTQDRLIPDCVRAFTAGHPVALRNPAATRPWQHVLEPLCGYLLLAERLHDEPAATSPAFNFGPPAEDVQPVAEIVERLAEAWGGPAWHVASEDGPHEAGALAVDAALARQHLGWRPRLPLPAALDWTVRWYREHAAGTAAASLVQHQIARYEALDPHA